MVLEAGAGHSKRQERHHGVLQARARPVAYERADEKASSGSAQEIRNAVENSDAGAGLAPLVKRIGDNDGDRVGAKRAADDTDAATTSSSSGSGSSSSSKSSSSRSTATSASSTRTSSSATRQATSSSSSRSSSSSKGLLEGLFGDSTSSSSTRSSSSSSPSSTRTSSSTSAAVTTSTAAQSSSSTVDPSTSVAFVTTSATPTADAAATTSSAPKETNDGPGAGPIIGIVAGALAGAAVLAVIIGFIIKKMGKKQDPYEANPFDRDEYHRHSVRLPDGFDGDDGYQPSMSEMHGNRGAFMGDHDEYGNVAAGIGAAGAAGAAGYAASSHHDEPGRPRPPTMFQRHMDHQAMYGASMEAPQMPSRMHSTDDHMPQLPPIALGGSDPYSLAGVGRHNTASDNINNPYGYLDRSMSASSPSPPRFSPNMASPPQHAVDYANLERSGSDGSSRQPTVMDYDNFSGHAHDTAGRPGTAEGRSGTPDLPNMQQTYALGGGNQLPDAREHVPGSPYNGRMAASPEHMSEDMYGTMSPGPHQHYSQMNQQPSLQVRNLLPNPNPHSHPQHNQQRPISTASETNEEAAYDGVW